MDVLAKILAEIEAGDAAAQSRKNWSPARQGELDIRIGADGSWYHEGRRFQRESLVKLFASVLRREADGYYLVTPAEKLRIQVDDAPFVANLVERIDDNGRQAIVFTTTLGERVVVDREHPLRVEIDSESGEPRPYVRLRDGLEALIGRGAFFDLVDSAAECERDGARYLCVSSLGHTFELGRCDE